MFNNLLQSESTGGSPPPDGRTVQIAAHMGAAFFDLSSRAKMMVSGGDASALLQSLATADVASLPVHGVCYTAFLNPTGHVLADGYVHRLPEGYLLHTEPELREQLPAYLRRYVLRSKVAISDATEAWALILVVGPLSGRVVCAALEQPETSLAERDGRQCWMPVSEDMGALAFHWQMAGASGVGLLAPAGAAPVLGAQVAAAGAVAGTAGDLDALRIEGGTPRYGRDMDESTLALEAHISRAISETKGCYVGQEVVARILARGHCNRALVGLLLGSADPGQVESAVTANSKSVGRVTSVARSHWLGQTIALAYVRRQWASPGSAVQVGYGGGTIQATVTELPFASSGQTNEVGTQ